MFSLFKKSPSKKHETMNHPEMGELIHDGFWQGHAECKIFNRVSQIALYINDDFDHIYELSAQEQSYRYYYDNEERINAEIAQELYDAYELDNSFDLGSRFEPTTLIIHVNGDCGLSFRDNTEPRGWSSAQIVVTIIPKVECFGSEDDYF